MTGWTGASSAVSFWLALVKQGLKPAPEPQELQGCICTKGKCTGNWESCSEIHQEEPAPPAGNQTEKNREGVMGHRYQGNVKSQPYRAPGRCLPPLLVVFFVGKCHFTHFGADCCSRCPGSWTCSSNSRCGDHRSSSRFWCLISQDDPNRGHGNPPVKEQLPWRGL